MFHVLLIQINSKAAKNKGWDHMSAADTKRIRERHCRYDSIRYDTHVHDFYMRFQNQEFWISTSEYFA